MFYASLSNSVEDLQPLLFMSDLPHSNGFGSPAVPVVEPLRRLQFIPPCRPGLSVLKQLSSEVAVSGNGL